jgi:hypothetical protein
LEKTRVAVFHFRLCYSKSLIAFFNLIVTVIQFHYSWSSAENKPLMMVCSDQAELLGMRPTRNQIRPITVTFLNLTKSYKLSRNERSLLIFLSSIPNVSLWSIQFNSILNSIQINSMTSSDQLKIIFENGFYY